MEPKFRKLPKKSQSLQEKVLKFDAAIEFLKAVGFKEEQECWGLNDYSKEKLEDASRAVEAFVQSMGAQVKRDTDFDPFKASVSSTAGMSNVQIVQAMDKQVPKSKLELQNEEIARIKKERIQAYEGRIEDREIDVYNHDSMIVLAQ